MTDRQKLHSADPQITAVMREVLGHLCSGPMCAQQLGCSIETLRALERRRLIRVDTTFDSIVFPRRARANITDDGRRMAGRR